MSLPRTGLGCAEPFEIPPRRRITAMLDKSLASLATLRDALDRQRFNQEAELQRKLQERRLVRAHTRKSRCQKQEQIQQGHATLRESRNEGTHDGHER